MYYTVSVDHNSMAAHLIRSECEGVLRSAVYPVHWMGLMMIWYEWQWRGWECYE